MWRIVVHLLLLLAITACSREHDHREAMGSNGASHRTLVDEITTIGNQPDGGNFRQVRHLDRRASSTASFAGANVTTNSTDLKTGKLYIRGRVRTEDGAPSRELKLALFGKEGLGTRISLAPQPDGTFQVEGESGFVYRLKATAEGYAPAVSDDLTLKDKSINDVVLILNRGRTISGTVENAAGEPVRNATMSIVPASGHFLGHVHYEPSMPTNDLRFLGRGETDRFGSFSLQRMPRELKLDVVAEHSRFAYPANYRLDKCEKDTTGLILTLPASGILDGIVVSDSGEPVANAEVRYGANENLVTWSDSDESNALGRFEIDPVPVETTGTLTVKAPGFYDYSEKLRILDGEVTVTLEREQDTTVTVRVLDAETRQLVTSASVSAAGENDKRMTKLVYRLEPGVFQIQHQKKRGLHIVAVADGYMSATYDNNMGTEDEQSINLLMRREVTVTGRVVDGKSRKPVEDATFSTTGGRADFASSRSDGRFEFVAVGTSENYWITASDARISKELALQLPASGKLEIGDVEVWGTEPLIIKVVRAHDNQPMPGARVETSQYRRYPGQIEKSGLTDFNGQFLIEVSAQDQVQVKLPDWNLEKSVEPTHGCNEWLVTILVGGGSLQGKLLYNGKPVAGSVDAEHTQIAGLRNKGVNTGSDGRYELKNLTPGRWSLRGLAMADQLATARVIIGIPEEVGQIERDIELGEEGSRVKGRVINSEGDPVAGARVTIETTGANGGVETMADGSFETWPVDPENCLLQAKHEAEGRSDSVVVQPPDDGQGAAPMLLTLRKGNGRVSCEIVSIVDGLPIAGTVLILEKEGKQYASAYQVWPVDSPLLIENLVAGNYIMRASAAGHSVSTRSISVGEGETVEKMEILSPAARVVVSAVDARGYLINGASVMMTPLDQDSLQPILNSTTDDRGSARFENVAYGSYQVEVKSMAGVASGTVAVRYQTEVTVHLVVGSEQ